MTANNAGGILGRVIARHKFLRDIRESIREDIGTRLTGPAAERLIDLLTVATATWLVSIFRCDHQSERFGAIVDQLWAAAGKLAGCHPPHSRAEAEVCRDRAHCAETSFWALIDYGPMFQRAAQTYFHMPTSRHHALTTALLLPPPMGTNWQAAEKPIGKVIDEVERNHEKEETGGGRIAPTDGLYRGVDRGTIPLEEVADITAEAVLVRCYTECSLSELQQAVSAADDELRAYIQARLCPGGTLEDICRHLGWTNARGRRVSKRFRRLRNEILRQTDLHEDRVVSGRGDRAPATWYLERLYSGRGVYQHMSPGPAEFYGRKPVKD
ncbi:MAG: hypothetical protein ACLQPN_00700 [Bryobacteraceae bacterium]